MEKRKCSNFKKNPFSKKCSITSHPQGPQKTKKNPQTENRPVTSAIKPCLSSSLAPPPPSVTNSSLAQHAPSNAGRLVRPAPISPCNPSPNPSASPSAPRDTVVGRPAPHPAGHRSTIARVRRAVRANVRNVPTRACVCAVCTAHCSLYVCSSHCSSVLPEMKK